MQCNECRSVNNKEKIMSFATLSRDQEIATLTLRSGKVNALHDAVVDELHEQLKAVEADDSLRAVILTGEGKFFSFGFDIPRFLSYSREAFTIYLEKFSSLCAYIFLFPKPVIAALNGHTIAGGCMISTACDYRLMVAGKAKISLNEINFGSSVFAGTVAMLSHSVGSANAGRVLLSGKMHSAEEALELGLIDKVTSETELPGEALKAAKDLAGKDGAAFRSIKHLLWGPIAEEMLKREGQSIREFVDIWYSENTWKNLQLIKITD